MKVRPWPHYDVILRHEFVVIALARDLSEPVTHLVSLHAHWSLLGRSVTNAQPHHLRFALRRWAASSVNGCSLATSRHLSSLVARVKLQAKSVTCGSYSRFSHSRQEHGEKLYFHANCASEGRLKWLEQV